MPRTWLKSMAQLALNDVIFFSVNLATTSASNPENASLQKQILNLITFFFFERVKWLKNGMRLIN